LPRLVAAVPPPLTKSDTIGVGKTGDTPKPPKKDAPPFADLFSGFFGPKADPPPEGVAMRDLPVTLPSLNIAILRVPSPMTELDFTTLIDSLNAWKPALTAKPKEAGGVVSGRRYAERDAADTALHADDLDDDELEEQ
jgi:hypothetical protein